tara:strand:+ start:790 stop:1764 length:975 start_codon:yes stop_codon:yes gene_type:complete
MVVDRRVIVCIMSTILVAGFLPSSQAQAELPSWEVGWETDMGGTYELTLSGEDGILDTIEFFVDNQRMGDLNLEITIEWDESDNIPIKLDYEESISIPASDNQTFAIEISDNSGYSFEKSPDVSMTLLLTAEEISFEQAVSSNEIDAELSVPAVFEMELSSKSNDESLYSGSSVEYDLTITNNGNTKDVIKMPESSIKSCPSLSIEGLEALNDVEVENASSMDFTIRIVASESHPERSCEVTISLKSAGDGDICSTIFQIEVNSVDSETGGNSNSNTNSNETEHGDDSDISEVDTLNFISILELISLLVIAIFVKSRNIVIKCQ